MKKLSEIQSWEEMKNRVIWGDCLEGMKLLPDKSIDLIITDPPYGIGEAAGKNKSRSVLARSKDYGELRWDDEGPSSVIFDEMKRVSKNQIIFGGNYFAACLGNSSCWIVWDKDNGENDFADCELAWTSFPSAVRKFKFKWQGMLQEDMKHKEIRVHPTQKPAELIRWLLGKFAKQGEIILDPFMGSWTTARACKDLGFTFLGFELEENYCRIGEERLKQEVLF